MRVKVKNIIYNSDFVTLNATAVNISIPTYHLFVVIGAESDEAAEMIFNRILISGYCDVKKYQHIIQYV